MIRARVSSGLNGWATTRCELLNTRICDLGLRLEGSWIEPLLKRLRREMAAKRLRFQPSFYLADSWGCPDKVPVIGVPFYLADRRLARIEEEQTGEVEDAPMVMMLLRHEAGHAVNYAYRLWEDRQWADVFGAFSRPYRDVFRPQHSSRDFVRHLLTSQYGRSYAQKHPDEDFAETFAVWLTPRSPWRRKYRGWPAMRKLRYVDRLMRRIRSSKPQRTGGRLVNPVEEMKLLLADHYGQRIERFRSAAQGYVDDKLRRVFPPIRVGPAVSARSLLRKHRRDLLMQIVRWSGLEDKEAEMILDKLEDRTGALRSRFARGQLARKLIEVGSVATALAMELAYTGQIVG